MKLLKEPLLHFLASRSPRVVWIRASCKKVYDVVWSDNRTPNVSGKPPPVGDSVDVENATRPSPSAPPS